MRRVEMRRAELADVPGVMALVERSMPLMHAAGNYQWSKGYPNAKIFAEDVRLRQLWVVERDGAIAGMVAVTADQSSEFAAIGWQRKDAAVFVQRLGVAPEFRGLGLAELLMRHAEVVAEGWGLRTVRLATSAENMATQSLFPKLGYVFAGEVRLEFWPGLRVLCYEKKLGESAV